MLRAWRERRRQRQVDRATEKAERTEIAEERRLSYVPPDMYGEVPGHGEDDLRRPR